MIYHHKTGEETLDLRVTPYRSRGIPVSRFFFSAKSIEFMLVDALLKADPYLKIAERIYDPRRFMYLDDSIILEVERSECPVSNYALSVIPAAMRERKTRVPPPAGARRISSNHPPNPNA